MKNTSLLFLFVLFLSNSFGQLIFEIKSPQNIAGIYPTISSDTNWNSPDLSINGNWFSDSIVIANDGISASACSSIQNNISGNFAIVHRQGCQLKDLLLNIQNAGATGALIIDTVSGRPLPFSDSIDTNITIPFIIISKDIGLSILNEINSNNIVTTSFGDKTGTTNNDVGIYMETSWWSMYGTFPFSKLTFTDSTWGSWVYNHGIDTVFNAQLKFWYKINEIDSGEVISSPFDILPMDSLYVPLILNFVNTQLYSPMQNTWQYYGYELININDTDTLDNSIRNKIYFSHEILSKVFIPNNTPNIEIDYEIAKTTYYCNFKEDRYRVLVNSNMSFNLNFTYNFINSNDNIVDSYITIYHSDSLTSINNHFLVANYYYSDVLNYNPTFPTPNWYESSCYDLTQLFFINDISWNHFKTYNFKYIAEFITNNTDFFLSSDMYHDLRIQEDSMFSMIGVCDSQYEVIEHDKRLTSIDFIKIMFSEGGWCTSGLLENSNVSFSISPNPASKLIKIESDSKISSITIFNIYGEEIYAEKNNAPSTTIDVRNYSAGIYFIQIMDNNGNLGQKKLIIE